jgi:hypothetical protein
MDTMKVRVYYDRTGNIMSVVEVKTDPDTPPTGIFSIPGTNELVLDLTESQAAQPLIALHVGYFVDTSQKEPRLIPIVLENDKMKQAKPRRKSK